MEANSEFSHVTDKGVINGMQPDDLAAEYLVQDIVRRSKVDDETIVYWTKNIDTPLGRYTVSVDLQESVTEA